jgi:integrase
VEFGSPSPPTSGTGMRKGEALGLHWADVHLDEGVLYVRYTLSIVDNNRLVITGPKTPSSRSWVAISPRVAVALRRGPARVGPVVLIRRTPSRVSSSLARTAGRCVRSPCWLASAAGPPRPGCPGPRCTTCGTRSRR